MKYLKIKKGCRIETWEYNMRVANFKYKNVIRPKRSERESPKIPSIYTKPLFKGFCSSQTNIFPKNHNFPET